MWALHTYQVVLNDISYLACFTPTFCCSYCIATRHRDKQLTIDNLNIFKPIHNPILNCLDNQWSISCLHSPVLGATSFCLLKLPFTGSTVLNWSAWKKKMEKRCSYWTNAVTSPRVQLLHENAVSRATCTTTLRSCRLETPLHQSFM